MRCVANKEILQDILRDYVGFDGMVVSDYTAIDQIPINPSQTILTSQTMPLLRRLG
ncbi:MAG: hypothetical protein H7707_00580 [Acetobacter sp.]|nr:hypothetical protein [Acetobacter sp.]